MATVPGVVMAAEALTGLMRYHGVDPGSTASLFLGAEAGPN